MDGTLAASAPTAAASSGSRGMRGLWLVAALAVALAAAGVAVLLYGRRAPEAASPMHFEMSLPGLVGSPVLSPDGKSIAYTTQPADGKRMLSIRPIGSENGQPIAGTENINGMMWSPDSRRIATVADGVLKIIDLATGSSRQIGDRRCDARRKLERRRHHPPGARQRQRHRAHVGFRRKPDAGHQAGRRPQRDSPRASGVPSGRTSFPLCGSGWNARRVRDLSRVAREF